MRLESKESEELENRFRDQRCVALLPTGQKMHSVSPPPPSRETSSLRGTSAAPRRDLGSEYKTRSRSMFLSMLSGSDVAGGTATPPPPSAPPPARLGQSRSLHIPAPGVVTVPEA